MGGLIFRAANLGNSLNWWNKLVFLKQGRLMSALTAVYM